MRVKTGYVTHRRHKKTLKLAMLKQNIGKSLLPHPLFKIYK